MLKRLFALWLAASLLLSSPGGTAWLWAAEPSPDSATLDGVEVGPDRVTLLLSRPGVKYNTFVTADPPRLVVELLNTEYRPETKTQAGQGRYLKKVRSGQYQKEPPMISRIVLDLVRSVGYQARWEGRNLVVSLQLAGAPGSETEKPAAMTAPAVEKAEPARPAAAKAPAVEKEEPAPVPPPAKPANVQAPAPPKPAKAAASPGYSSELSDMAEASDAAAKDRGRESEPARQAAAAASSAGFERRARRDIMTSLPTEPTTVDWPGTDIRDVLHYLSEKAKVNIIYGADVSGPVTLRLTEVPFNEIFLTVLQINGLVADQAGENILRVMSPATLAKERAVAVNETRVIKLKYSKASEIKAAVAAVRAAENRGGALNSDDNTNSLIVTDTLEGIAKVERLLAKLDVRPQQVMIEAKLVEVKLTKDLNFGIQWDYFGIDSGQALGKQGLHTIGSPIFPSKDPFGLPLDQNEMKVPGVSSSGGAIGAVGRGTGVFLPASKVFGAFTFGRVTNNYFLSATLTAAASQGKVKVLSDPKIATLNGKKASINITTQIPYATSNVASTGVTSQSVSNITTGIQLDVTPTINADGRITIEVNPTVSQPSGTVASAVVGVPAVDMRTAKTTVLVQDGETIVIGGLITDSVLNTVAKVPLLGDIPLIGWLFKKKTVERSRVELLIFVTPRVLPS